MKITKLVSKDTNKISTLCWSEGNELELFK